MNGTGHGRSPPGLQPGAQDKIWDRSGDTVCSLASCGPSASLSVPELLLSLVLNLVTSTTSFKVMELGFHKYQSLQHPVKARGQASILVWKKPRLREVKELIPDVPVISRQNIQAGNRKQGGPMGRTGHCTGRKGCFCLGWEVSWGEALLIFHQLVHHVPELSDNWEALGLETLPGSPPPRTSGGHLTQHSRSHFPGLKMNKNVTLCTDVISRTNGGKERIISSYHFKIKIMMGTFFFLSLPLPFLPLLLPLLPSAPHHARPPPPTVVSIYCVLGAVLRTRPARLANARAAP